MKEYKIAIIGGHGLVAITLFGTKNSEVTIGERSFNIVRIDEDSIEHYDVVFMCCSNEISEKYTPFFIFFCCIEPTGKSSHSFVSKSLSLHSFIYCFVKISEVLFIVNLHYSFFNFLYVIILSI